jgi:dihydroneopterin aldolase
MEVERELGQVFLVDVTLGLDLDSGSESPSAEAMLTGGVIYDLAKNVMMGTKFKSHTSLALRLSHEMIEHLKNVTDATVAIERKQLFIPGEVRSIVVQVSCTREEYEKRK